MTPYREDQVASQSPLKTTLRMLGSPLLRKRVLRCFYAIMYNFFFLQYKAALLPGRIPVTAVDHPLDQQIPFRPRWVAVYLDFMAFWIRSLGFLLSRYGRRAGKVVGDSIDSMIRLYYYAAEVYQKNFSTTDRPRYYGRPRFVLIHATDPHLMCIPSLHVMVVINTYTRFRAMLRALGEEERCAAQIEEIRQGALDITEVILYVKQHSINCVAASLYTMTRFDPVLFPEAEARRFTEDLFIRPGSPAESGSIREYIMAAYKGFLEAGQGLEDWKRPLLDFLARS